MKSSSFYRTSLLLPLLVLRGSATEPEILQHGVVNAASRMPHSLAGGALAPGSRIRIEGLRFDPATEFRVRQGDSTRSLQVLERKGGVVVALLPLDLRPGKAELIVSNRDERSRPFPLHLVAASFGIEVRDELGWSIGNVDSIPSRRPVTVQDPASPGSRIRIRGTGLGSATGPEVFAGGQRATLLSARHLAAEPGIDELVIQLPNNVPTGCYVPMYVRTGPGQVSNTVALPIGRKSPCTQPALWDLPQLREGDGGGLVFVTRLVLRIGPGGTPPIPYTSEHSSAVFVRVSPGEDLLRPMRPMPPPGTCTTYTHTVPPDRTLTDLSDQVLTEGNQKRLDAGPAITVGSQGREIRIVRKLGIYEAKLGGRSFGELRGLPLFLSPGGIVVKAGGGPDVGAFEASSVFESLTWTNRDAIDSIDRGRPLTLRWSGPASRTAGIVVVNVDQFTSALGACFCVASPGSSEFTVPPDMLANLPEYDGTPGIPYNFLLLASIPAAGPAHFSAKGLKDGLLVTAPIEGRTIRIR